MSNFESEIKSPTKPQDLKERTQALALRVIRMVQALPRDRVSEVIGKQVLRSATSVGANYRSACRGRSKPDFISKLGIAEEEADETCYWIELLIKSGIVNESKIDSLLNEAREVTAILTAAGRTAKQNREGKGKK
jgi:four helix bundle protein